MSLKTKKIISFFFCTLFILSSVFFSLSSLAKEEGDLGLGSLKNLGSKGLLIIENENPAITLINRILGWFLGIVGVILIVFLVYGGFMYLTSAGSEEKVKKAKSILLYAIIGMVVVAAAWIIANFVAQVITKEAPPAQSQK